MELFHGTGSQLLCVSLMREEWDSQLSVGLLKTSPKKKIISTRTLKNACVKAARIVLTHLALKTRLHFSETWVPPGFTERTLTTLGLKENYATSSSEATWIWPNVEQAVWK